MERRNDILSWLWQSSHGLWPDRNGFAFTMKQINQFVIRQATLSFLVFSFVFLIFSILSTFCPCFDKLQVRCRKILTLDGTSQEKISLAAVDFTDLCILLVRVTGDYGLLDIYICKRQAKVSFETYICTCTFSKKLVLEDYQRVI